MSLALFLIFESSFDLFFVVYLTPSESTKAPTRKLRPYRGRGKLSKSRKRSKYDPKQKHDPDAITKVGKKRDRHATRKTD